MRFLLILALAVALTITWQVSAVAAMQHPVAWNKQDDKSTGDDKTGPYGGSEEPECDYRARIAISHRQ